MLKSTSFSTAPTAIITTPATTTVPVSSTNSYWLGVTITIAPYVLISATAILLVVLFHLIRNQQQLSQPYQNQPRQRVQSKARVAGGQVCRELESKLLLLLNNERDTAERLVRQVMKSNPGQTEKWYLEKVIWDLERDRG